MRPRSAMLVLTAILVAGCSGNQDGDGAPEVRATEEHGSTGTVDPTGTDITTGAVDPTGTDITTGAVDPTGTDVMTATVSADETGGSDSTDASVGVPRLEVGVVAEGLSIPWDVHLLPDGAALVGERGGRLVLIPPGGQPREVEFGVTDLFAQGEAGLMGLAVSPDVSSDRVIWACYASQADDSPQDVRVVRLVLDEGRTRAEPDAVVVDGLPLTSGRHSGCRLLLSDDGEVLLVGTGDAADPDTPQSTTSLGGKVLAVTPDGDPLPGAPFVDGADPRILTLGHRNVQGLAVQRGSEERVPGVGTVWSVEHGPDVDDEVNVLVPGGNYGWDPGPGYDERVPMTDREAFPDAVQAVWSSGRPTHATSGAVFLEGAQWGAWEGALAIAELRGEGVTVLTTDGQQVVGEERMRELDGTHGRLRSLTLDEEGALWVTTSNGDGQDEVLRVTARDGR